MVTIGAPTVATTGATGAACADADGRTTGFAALALSAHAAHAVLRRAGMPEGAGRYPPRPAGALERRPRGRTDEERAFLGLGEGAKAWLVKAAAQGTTRVRRKMAEAVDLAKLHGPDNVERALAACAAAGCFGDGDLAAILAHQACAEVIKFPMRVSEPSEATSMQRSTAAWEGFGR